jgi:hypothetical protein
MVEVLCRDGKMGWAGPLSPLFLMGWIEILNSPLVRAPPNPLKRRGGDVVGWVGPSGLIVIKNIFFPPHFMFDSLYFSIFL